MNDPDHRNKMLQDASEVVEAALPRLYGSAKFNLQDGRVVNVNIEESVRIREILPRK